MATGDPTRPTGGRPLRTSRTVVVTLLTALVTAACATETEDPDQDGSQDRSGVLAGVCPDPVVIQTSWWPQVEHGHEYQLLGDDYTIDADNLRVTGPLMASGEDTGVDIELRAGGPAIGFQDAISLMYQDDDIMFASALTDDQINLYADTPAQAVVAPLDRHPLIVMWDPETYPEFNTVVDVGNSDATVLYFEGAFYMEYLVSAGILRREQLDSSYDGQPARWVAEDGAVAQQGFATNEPYVYEHEVEQWGEPVEFQLVHDLGYEVYPNTLTIRADRKDELAGCLELLVPMIQQSMVDFMADPGPVSDLILELVDAYEGFPYSEGLAEYGVSQMERLEIVSNGANETIGDFDLERVQETLDLVRPILAGMQSEVPEDLTAEDLATNEFVDESIALP